jgi:hypothetical protein
VGLDKLDMTGIRRAFPESNQTSNKTLALSSSSILHLSEFLPTVLCPQMQGSPHQTMPMQIRPIISRSTKHKAVPSGNFRLCPTL